MVDRGRATARRTAALIALSALTPAALATSFEAPAAPPRLEIPRVDRAPTLEDFIEMKPPADLAGRLARAERFIQQSPEDGRPSTQNTQVFLGYDDLNLYVVFVAFDSEPDRIRAHLSRRENVFGDETVEIQLDTFNDQRRAFSFLTNPHGVQWDAIWTEGQGFDESWDTVWQSRGRITDNGYVTWMAIPFKSLRFSSEAEQIWRVVFVRDIPRNNETAFWPRVSNRIEGRLNQAATLHGLRDISPGRNLQLIPYATSRSFRSLDDDVPRFERDAFDADAGLDAKFVVRDSLAIDLTLNPDFSQVESDQPQATVNERFEVFFPEKRPFFLENSDYFQTPIDLLFTRRVVDPRVGARVTGKLGAYTLGAMLIDDESPGKLTEPGDPLQGKRATFGTLRMARDLPKQSHLGLIYTGREIEEDSNHVAGIDGRVKLSDNWATQFQAVHSATDTVEEGRMSDPAYHVDFKRRGRKLNLELGYRDIGRDFRTDAGFVPRTDFRRLHEWMQYSFRPEGKRLVSWGPELWSARSVDQSGTRLDWTFNPGMVFQLRRGTGFGAWYWVGQERLRPEDFDTLTEARDFDSDGWSASFWSDYFSFLGLRATVWISDSINFVPPDGRPPTASETLGGRLTVTLRPHRRLINENRYLLTRLDDRTSGRRIFTDQIVRSQWSWQFNPKLSLRTILQYQHTDVHAGLTSLEPTESFNADLLVTYLLHPGTALYVGHNTNYQNLGFVGTGPNRTLFRTDGNLLNDSRQLFVKLSYLFRP